MSALGSGSVLRKPGRARCWLCTKLVFLALVRISGNSAAMSGRLIGLTAGSAYSGIWATPLGANGGQEGSAFFHGGGKPAPAPSFFFFGVFSEGGFGRQGK